MTGIDRVEFAYLRHLMMDQVPLFALVRSAAGWLLLEAEGCQRFAAMVADGTPLPAPDLLSRLLHRGDSVRARAETAVRRLAVARAPRPALGRLLRRVPKGTSYLNVGHSNLTAASLASLRKAGLLLTVMIHDTIPLDHPDFARSGTVEPFRARLAAVATHATRVIHLTHATRAMTEAQLARFGPVPEGVVAPLGVDRPSPDPAALPRGLDLTPPYFVALGTIEPRKNHALLLDLWSRLPAPVPRLFILGNRGWADAALLRRIDALPPDGPVRVISGLPDGAVAMILSKATALLAPSLAEGFGLPPVEAASLGTPVIATDLAVTRELLGNKAVYLPPSDIYSWMDTIVRLAVAAPARVAEDSPWDAPSWDAHFKAVLSIA
jgi:glycosyltransferase involved in cell wall biosynthesis